MLKQYFLKSHYIAPGNVGIYIFSTTDKSLQKCSRTNEGESIMIEVT